MGGWGSWAKGGRVRVLGKGWVGEWVGEGLGQRVGGWGSSWWRERQEKAQCFPPCINIFLYKIKNCKNNCKMWRIGNCFLSAPVHIPPNEIPHQTAVLSKSWSINFVCFKKERVNIENIMLMKTASCTQTEVFALPLYTTCKTFPFPSFWSIA